MKVRLAILDEDKSYVGNFYDYINKNYFGKIDIYAFTNIDALLSFLKYNSIDILLINDSIKLEFTLDSNIICIFLVEKILINNKPNSIFKYQKTSLICKELLDCYSMIFKAHDINCEPNSACKIISFLSTGVGSGTSTVALAFSQFLINRDKRTLFLDLQLFPTVGCVLHSEGKLTMSEIFYAIKSKKIDIATRLESALRKDATGLFYYEPCHNPIERSEVEADDVAELLTLLKSSGSYDYIVIDSEYIIHDICIAIMNNSDKFIFVSNTSEASECRLDDIIKSLEITKMQSDNAAYERINVIYNQYVSGRGKLNKNEKIIINGYIPKYSSPSVPILIKEISELNILRNIIEEGVKDEFII